MSPQPGIRAGSEADREAVVSDQTVAPRQDGFTVLEAAISMVILAVALLTLWGTLVYCSRSNLAAEQKKKALNAAQGMVEEMKSKPFDTLIDEYGPSGTEGNTFPVPNLDTEESRAYGQIAFFVDETCTDDSEKFGGPLDLNGDGDMSDADVSATYQLLPIRVRVQWEGSLGLQHVEVHTVLRKEE
jgi:hypothetical protein